MYSMLYDSYDSYDVISWQIATLNTSQLSLENISAKKLKQPTRIGMANATQGPASSLNPM